MKQYISLVNLHDRHAIGLSKTIQVLYYLQAEIISEKKSLHEDINRGPPYVQ